MTDTDGVRLARSRLRLVGGVFGVVLAGLAYRTIDLAFSPDPDAMAPTLARAATETSSRADIVDRHGVLLAADYPLTSVYANPKQIVDSETVAGAVAGILDLDPAFVAARLERSTRFVWLKRHISERERQALVRLGDPGIGFRTEMHRVYPQGALASHVVGYVGVENQGLAGIERSFDQRLLGSDDPLDLTLDVRIQAVVRDVLEAAVGRFRALGGSGLVLDIERGEVLASVSLPDFDPNHYQRSAAVARFNRNTLGSYELGSIFKLFTVAMALNEAVMPITGGVDATEPFSAPPHRIRDFHAHKRWLSVPEIVAFSSNIGAAHMAETLGEERQLAYFGRLGLTERPSLRLPEVAAPQLPSPWRPINTITASYGHGIAVSPLQAADALASLLCAVPRPRAHFVRDENDFDLRPPPVDSRTTAMLRWLMWLTVAEGTGSQAAVEGYMVGGKTGSADQAAGASGYQSGSMLASFIGAFPMNQPRYVVLVTLDDPQGRVGAIDQAQGGWTAAPTVGGIIRRIGPILGMAPVAPEAEAPFRARLVVGEAFNGRLRQTERSLGVMPGMPWVTGDQGGGECGCGPCSVIG